MKDFLDVYLKGRKVGSIQMDTDVNAMTFAYDEVYLADKESVAVSLSLPLQQQPFDAYRTRVFFENLLPPEVVRRRLEPIIHHDRNNIFAFLKYLGGDCAGAIALYPAGDDPSTHEDVVRELDDRDAAEILKALPGSPLLQGVVEGYRISVAGAQDKLVARIREGRVSLPLFGSASTHIIKPAMVRCPSSVENECFCQRLAADVGIESARSSILRVGGCPYYVTERYDRAERNGRIVRYLQEDFCQAMGIDAERKYQIDGGPSAARCFRFLRDHGFGLQDQMRYIDQFLLNFLLGNADAHAKNFSLVSDDSGVRLAPAYDVMSTAVYANVVNSMAMSIGGQYEFGAVNRESFAKFAEQCDISPKAILARLDALAAKLPRAAAELKTKMSDEGHPSPVYDEIITVVNRQIDQTR